MSMEVVRAAVRARDAADRAAALEYWRALAAERAGVQHSLITRHFTSKDHLVAVALGRLAGRSARRVVAVAGGVTIANANAA